MKKKKVTPSYRTLLKMDYDQLTNWYIEKNPHLTAKQIEAARRAITRKVKRKGKLWINVFPHIPVTSKPTEVRMGKGKGSLSYWCCPLKPGTLIFELDGVSQDLAKQALTLGANKLPFKTKFITNYTTLKD